MRVISKCDYARQLGVVFGSVTERIKISVVFLRNDNQYIIKSLSNLND